MYQGECFCRILLSGGGATLPLYCYNLLVIRASSMLIYRQYIHPDRAAGENLPKTDEGAAAKMRCTELLAERLHQPLIDVPHLHMYNIEPRWENMFYDVSTCHSFTLRSETLVAFSFASCNNQISQLITLQKIAYFLFSCIFLFFRAI